MGSTRKANSSLPRETFPSTPPPVAHFSTPSPSAPETRALVSFAMLRRLGLLADGVEAAEARGPARVSRGTESGALFLHVLIDFAPAVGIICV
jgi:hypothetical protein